MPCSRCYGRTAALRLTVQPCGEDGFFPFFQVMEHRWNESDRGNQSTRGKTCPSATLSTTNPTWTDPWSNPGLLGERPVINRLGHGTAYITLLWMLRGVIWMLTFNCDCGENSKLISKLLWTVITQQNATCQPWWQKDITTLRDVPVPVYIGGVSVMVHFIEVLMSFRTLSSFAVYF
jgi:hypothetical protein